jgi:hypothetical protein
MSYLGDSAGKGVDTVHIPQMVDSIQYLYRVSFSPEEIQALVQEVDLETRRSLRVRGSYAIWDEGYTPDCIPEDVLLMDATRLGLDVDTEGSEELRNLVQECLNERFSMYFYHRLHDAGRRMTEFDD